jgi:putative FmdB family regulatory protein
MPIYEYVCQACETRFEKLVRQIATANVTPACPNCDCHDTERVMSTFARHGEPGVDHEAHQAESAAAERMASITPKKQIDTWRSHRNKVP